MTRSKAPYHQIPPNNPTHQISSLKGSHSPKILHEILLPENRFISIFFEVKMFGKCQNVIFYAVLASFGTI